MSILKKVRCCDMRINHGEVCHAPELLCVTPSWYQGFPLKSGDDLLFQQLDPTEKLQPCFNISSLQPPVARLIGVKPACVAIGCIQPKFSQWSNLSSSINERTINCPSSIIGGRYSHS